MENVTVRFLEETEDEKLRFAVIIARYGGNWVFCRHRKRSTWEIPGGHREPGERIAETAARELIEETGAEEFSLQPVCVYSVTGRNRISPGGAEMFGMLYAAEIRSFTGKLHFETAEISLRKELPQDWTYPDIQPLMIREYERRKGSIQWGLTWRQMTDGDKRQICSWKYEGDYAIYNYPLYEEMERNRTGFMAPGTEQNWITFFDGNETVGFVNILEEADEVFIGIGVNPSLCGRHYGRRMLETAAQISGRRYPGKPLYLEVRAWNKRAVSCYQSAGFHIEGDPYELITGVGKGVFFRMVRRDCMKKPEDSAIPG